MARTPAQRGRVGAWLLQARLARGYETQADARREIERLAGWRIPQSQYAEWESGRRVPSEAAQERLQGFYGVPDAPQATETPDGIIAAIDRLTLAVKEQGEVQARSMDTLAEALTGLLVRLAAQPLPPQGGSAERPAGGAGGSSSGAITALRGR